MTALEFVWVIDAVLVERVTEHLCGLKDHLHQTLVVKHDSAAYRTSV